MDPIPGSRKEKNMEKFIKLGSAPCDETCAKINEFGYEKTAREECRRYIQLLRGTLGKEPEKAQLLIKEFPHDTETYYEVVCCYEDEESMEYASRCETEAPRCWAD